MNNRIKELHVLGMYLVAFFGILMVLLSNIDILWFNLLFTFCWLFSFTVRNLFFYKIDKYKKYSFLTYLIEIILLFIISIHGAGTSTRLLYIITTADCFISRNVRFGAVCAVASFLSYGSTFVIGQPFYIKNVLITSAKELPLFFIAALISYLMGRVIKSNEIVEKSMRAAEVRETLLKSAYDELRQAYENLEEMSAVKERNRIAREIHDNVGHTLTTVIVEMEAGRMLVEMDAELAVEKFIMAHGQAKRALEDLRRSVRMLAKEGELEKENFSMRQKVLDIIEETKLHAGINIRSVIDVPEEMDKNTVKLITRILKEGLSNGIRHGESTAFLFKLVVAGGDISFLLQDNGKGCNIITPGFGIENMKKSVMNSGGSIEFNSAPGEGFEIKFTLPLQGGGSYENYKSAIG